MALVVAASAASACGQGGEPAGADGALTYAVGDEPETFNPGLQDEHTDPVTELVFRGLTRHDEDNKVVPGLAKSWEVAPDGKTYTFALRPGTTWQDGKPFTSGDVKFTIEAIKGAGADSPLSRNFSMVTAVETPDPATVRLKLDEPFAPMLDALSTGMLPEHLLKGKKLTDPDFGRRPVGTGPFRLTTYKPGQYAELTAFDGYYEGAPGLKKIVVKYVPDDSARLIQLKNGEVDAAHLAPQQAGKAGGHRLEVYPTADYRALMFNMKDPVFADRRIRTAMNYAVDRELRVAILNVSATQLRKQGFDVDPRPRPRDWVRKHWGDLQGMVVGWGTPYDPDSSVYGVFASSQALAKGGSNYGTYSNPAADKALEEGRSTLDPAKRKAAYIAFQKALQDDPPFVWISYLKTINAVPKNLTGPAQRTLGHHGYGFFWNAETWRYN